MQKTFKYCTWKQKIITKRQSNTSSTSNSRVTVAQDEIYMYNTIMIKIKYTNN